MIVCLTEPSALDITIVQYSSSIIDESDKTLFQSVKINLTSKKRAPSLTISDSTRLAVKDYERKAQLQATVYRLEPIIEFSSLKTRLRWLPRFLNEFFPFQQ